jgi:hypothetical protein
MINHHLTFFPLCYLSIDASTLRVKVISKAIKAHRLAYLSSRCGGMVRAVPQSSIFFLRAFPMDPNPHLA